MRGLGRKVGNGALSLYGGVFVLFCSSFWGAFGLVEESGADVRWL